MKANRLLLILLLTPFMALAEIRNTPPSPPNNLHVYDTIGNTYVDQLLDTCGSRRYHLSPNHNKYDAIFSVLLAAQVSKKKVIIRYDGCFNNNQQGEIIGVYLSE